jgi:hypothetical protein
MAACRTLSCAEIFVPGSNTWFPLSVNGTDNSRLDEIRATPISLLNQCSGLSSRAIFGPCVAILAEIQCRGGFLRIAIFLMLLASLSCQAQVVSGPKTELAQAPSGGLKIVVIEGEGALNNIRTRSGAPLVVQVRDAGDKPVGKAEVVFQLPPAGPGGTFFGWLRNQTVRTGADGRAETTGFTPNEEQGRFNIKVTATAGTDTASAIISQSNTANGSGGSGKQAKAGKGNLWKVLLVVGAAGLAGGIVAATRGSSAATPPVPVTISAGPITIGGPR